MPVMLRDVLDVILNRCTQAKIRKPFSQFNNQDKQYNPWNTIGYSAQRATLDTWGKPVHIDVAAMLQVVLMLFFSGSRVSRDVHEVLIRITVYIKER